jgi:hypothetical protein
MRYRRIVHATKRRVIKKISTTLLFWQGGAVPP